MSLGVPPWRWGAGLWLGSLDLEELSCFGKRNSENFSYKKFSSGLVGSGQFGCEGWGRWSCCSQACESLFRMNPGMLGKFLPVEGFESQIGLGWKGP